MNSKYIEKWKQIEGHGGLYEVSNLGRVKSYAKSAKGKILAGAKDKDGYIRVGLKTIDGKVKWYQVHRLVGMAFLPNPENKETINHFNERKDDNEVGNLCWMTHRENVNYGTRNQRASEKLKKPVRAVNGDTVIIFDSNGSASLFFYGYKASHRISMLINNKGKTKDGWSFDRVGVA